MSPSPKYKLTYFNITALGEPVRYMLAYGQHDFEDVRIAIEDWGSRRKEFLLGKLPVLEIDGKTFHQSVALCRYLAKGCGLGGKDDLENLHIDMAAETFHDFRWPLWAWRSSPDSKTDPSKKEALIDGHVTTYLNYYEEKAKSNGGYLVDGRLTWADVYLTAPLDFYRTMLDGYDFLDKYPTLQSLEQKVKGIPQIASYLETRPPLTGKVTK